MYLRIVNFTKFVLMAHALAVLKIQIVEIPMQLFAMTIRAFNVFQILIVQEERNAQILHVLKMENKEIFISVMILNSMDFSSLKSEYSNNVENTERILEGMGYGKYIVRYECGCRHRVLKYSTLERCIKEREEKYHYLDALCLLEKFCPKHKSTYRSDSDDDYDCYYNSKDYDGSLEILEHLDPYEDCSEKEWIKLHEYLKKNCTNFCTQNVQS